MYFELAAPTIPPLDTVGAGDTFCGYLSAGLDGGTSLRESAIVAVTAARLACLAEGPQSSLPVQNQIVEALHNG